VSIHSDGINKVSVATETDSQDLNKLISKEEEKLMEKLKERENSLRSQSIAVQTSIEDESKEIETLVAKIREPVVIEKVDSPRVKPVISTTTTTYSPRLAEANKPKESKTVKLKDDKIDQDLDDEQCLSILQDMKRMDDDIKHELSKINEEESRKNELFDLIKNYQVLSKEERGRLEALLNKNEQSATSTQANASNQRQKIQIQNISLDAYLKTVDDNSGGESFKPSKSVEKVEIKVNQVKKDILPKPYLPTTETSDGIPTSAILAAKLQQKNQSINDIDIKVEPPAKKIESKESSMNKTQTQQTNNYESQFIDLLSLNLDRSKTWVEMTEAKLNYMIGETDAVLRTMCFDSSDDETKVEVITKSKKSETFKVEPKTEEIYHHHHHHFHSIHSPACLNCSRTGMYHFNI
jgi:hypothetical protein